MNEESKQWDRGKLFATFDRHTFETILTMPLNHQTTQDRLVWMENKAHTFTVRTAYQVALRLKQPNRAEHSSVLAQGNTWKKIWKLPPKGRNFLWRGCSGCLPKMQNLHKKRVRIDEHCELCDHQTETVSHVLWECPLARNVWALFKGSIQKCSNEPIDFLLLFQKMQQRLSLLELEKWATTTWMIWHARNKVYFEWVQLHPKVIFESALKWLEEYQRLNDAQRV